MSENSTSFALWEEALTILIYSLPSAYSELCLRSYFSRQKVLTSLIQTMNPQNVKVVQIKGPFSARQAITVAFPAAKVTE